MIVTVSRTRFAGNLGAPNLVRVVLSSCDVYIAKARESAGLVWDTLDKKWTSMFR
jgi:hypothetical protein